MVSSRNNAGRKNNHNNHHHNQQHQQQQQQQSQQGQQKQSADSDITRRLSEAEAENQELRDRLAETAAKLRAAEEQLAACAEGGSSGGASVSAAEREEAAAKALLDARLREAEQENESLRSKLAELATAPDTPPHRGAAAAAAAFAPSVFSFSPSSDRYAAAAKAGASGFPVKLDAATGSFVASSSAGEPKRAEEASKSVNDVRLSVARTALSTGSSALQDGDLVGAMDLLRRGLQSVDPLIRGPDMTSDVREAAKALEIELQLSVAEAASKQEDWAAALEAATIALEESPDNSTALHRRGVALARLGRVKEARVDLQEALQSGPNPDVERELRALSSAGGEAGEAESLEATLAKVREVLGTGSLAAKSNQHDVALHLLRGGLEALRSVVDAASAESGAADPMGKLFSEAADLEVELQTKIAASCLRQHDFREALEASEKALQRRPGDARATIAREAAVEGLKSMGEAEAQAAPAEAEDEDEGADGDGDGAAAAAAAAGEFLSQGSQAMELIRTCVCAAQGAKHLGNASLQSGDYDRAKEHYEQGLKMVEVLPIRETAAELGLDLGSLATSPGSPAATGTPDMKVLKDALELEIALQLNLSLVALKREDYDGVIEAATVVLDRRSSDAKALYRRGVARLRLGQKADACKDFKALLIQDPAMSKVVRCELERAYKVGKGKAHADWADIFKAAREAPAQDAEVEEEEADSDDDDEEEEEESESEEDEEEDEEEEVEEDEDSDGNKEAAARNFSKELTADAAGAAARAASKVAAAVAAGEGDDAAKKAKASQLVSVFEQAHAMKICGNEHFKKEEYDAAVWCYRQGALQANRAVALSTSSELSSFDGVTEEAQQLEVSLWLNLAQCRLKLGENAEAAAAADEALRLDPKSVKGLFRRAKANIAQASSFDDAAQAVGRGRSSESRELHGQALADLRSVLKLDPNNKEARKELVALRSLEADEVGGGGSSGGAAASAAGEGSGSPFAGMFGDQKVLRERHRQAKERRQVEECNRLREAGNMSHRVGDYSAAEVHYSAALELDPDSAQLLLNRAAARLMLEEYTTALEDCEKAIEIQPGVAKAYLRAAKCKQLLGDFEGAEAIIRKGLEKATSSSDHDDLDAQRRWLALTLRMVKDVEQSLAVDLEGATEGRRVMRLVDDLERQKQLPAAMLRPLRLRALLQARSSGTAQEALRLAEELLRQQPPPQGVARTELLFWKASACLFAGERGRAKATLRDVAAAEAEDSAERPVCALAAALLTRLLDSDGAKDRGNVFFKDRRWEDAVECYEEALRGAGQDLEFAAVLHTNISAALRKVEHREAEALKHASKAIEVNPRYAKAFFRRGVLHYDAGRWSQSFEDFRRARELEPNLQGLDKWLRRGRHAAREGKDRKNHYRALGLLCDCEQDEIKRKFRQLARECHPDKVRDAPASERSAAEARFKAVNEAHEVLGNESSRKEYDFGGADEEYDPFGGGGGFGGGFGGSHFGRQRRPPPRHQHFGGGRSQFRGGHNPWSRFGGGFEGSDDDFDWFG